MFSDRMIFGSKSHHFNSNVFFSPFILFLILALSCLAQVPTKLDPDEVETLKQINKTWSKSNWDLSVDPCSDQSAWKELDEGVVTGVTCNCLFPNDTFCHVVSIVLKRQNLQGELPLGLTKLRYLQQIDLTRNFLNGTIPPEWGAMPLVNISLQGNRLSGRIPKELGNSATLRELVLEANRFNGTIPEEIGKIVSLERFLISSNEFTGELPRTLANLRNLMDFRISDNNFTGKIPNFIQSWTKLETLAIQASGLEGPIPSGISHLENMTDMTISDINGTDSRFPSLSMMKGMKTLILRNCNLFGEIPPYVGKMTKLKTFDLSYNKLSGKIQDTFGSNPGKLQFMYLTGNLLTGDVPDWMRNKGNLYMSLPALLILVSI